MTTRQERLSRLEGAYEQVDKRLADLKDSVNSLRDEMNSRLDGVDRRFDALGSKFEAKLSVLIGATGCRELAIVLALLGIAFAG